jgi:hypothetical protein
LDGSHRTAELAVLSPVLSASHRGLYSHSCRDPATLQHQEQLPSPPAFDKLCRFPTRSHALSDEKSPYNLLNSRNMPLLSNDNAKAVIQSPDLCLAQYLLLRDFPSPDHTHDSLYPESLCLHFCHLDTCHTATPSGLNLQGPIINECYPPS